MTDIAYAAGFGSVRQFNDTVREVYATSPQRSAPTLADRASRCGHGHRHGVGPPPGAVAVRRATAAGVPRRPRRRRASKHWDGETYARTMGLPHGQATVALSRRRRPRCRHVPARRLARSGAGGRPCAAPARPRRRPDVDRRRPRNRSGPVTAGQPPTRAARRRQCRPGRDAGAGDRRSAGVGRRRPHRAGADHVVRRRTADRRAPPADALVPVDATSGAAATRDVFPMPAGRAETISGVGRVGQRRHRPARQRRSIGRRSSSNSSAIEGSARGPPSTS